MPSSPFKHFLARQGVKRQRRTLYTTSMPSSTRPNTTWRPSCSEGRGAQGERSRKPGRERADVGRQAGCLLSLKALCRCADGAQGQLPNQHMQHGRLAERG